MVVPLTSNLRRAGALGNVLLTAEQTGLQRASVALVCQVTAIDKSYLDDIAGTIPPRQQRAIDAGLKLTLSLS